MHKFTCLKEQPKMSKKKAAQFFAEETHLVGSGYISGRGETLPETETLVVAIVVT